MHDSEQADSDSELSKKLEKPRINLNFLILVTARAQYSEPFKFNIGSEE